MSRPTLNSSLKRRLQIVDIVRQQGDVKVETLSQQFGVSTVTIRSDLSYLEEQGFVVRAFGRARYNPRSQAQSPNLVVTGDQQFPRKRDEIALARFAAGLVEDGDTVMLGAGPLVHKMVPFLSERESLSIIVNEVQIVPTIRQFLDCSLHLLGGTLVEDCLELCGPIAEQTVRMQTMNKCFVQLEQLSSDDMLTHSNAAMASLYRSIVDHAQLTVGLTAKLNFPTTDGFPVCQLDDLDRLIVNPAIEDAVLDQIRHSHLSQVHTSDCVFLYAKT